MLCNRTFFTAHKNFSQSFVWSFVRSFIHKFTQCNDHHRNLRNVYRFYGTEHQLQFHKIRFVCTTNVWGVFLSGPFQLNQSQNHRENKQNSIKKMKIKNCCILNSFAFIGFSHIHILLLLAARSSHITLCFDFRWMCSFVCACVCVWVWACSPVCVNASMAKWWWCVCVYVHYELYGKFHCSILDECCLAHDTRHMWDYICAYTHISARTHQYMLACHSGESTNILDFLRSFVWFGVLVILKI